MGAVGATMRRSAVTTPKRNRSSNRPGGRLDTPAATIHPNARMSDTRDPDDDEGDRKLANIVLLVGFVVLVGGGIWIANAMLDARKMDECMSSGRRNCAPIETPAR
jgi:hypothetical protein